MKQKFLLFFFLSLSAAFPVAWSQAGGFAVTGIVKDKTGAGLADVTVSEKGRSNTIATDASGAFKIKVARQNATLVFSSVGFQTQEVKADQSNLNVTLAQTVKGLDEVTVVGYSIKRREQISSAVATVSGEKLRDITSNSLSQMLQGKAPGVTVSSNSGDPSAGSEVVVRGPGTINASTSPLYVVDGNIGGTFNPTDVESVTILKDAAATGLYGSRAANGVIIVTTRMGRAGKTRMEFNTTQGFAEATKGNFRLLNSQELYDYQKTYFNPNPAVLNTNTDWWSLNFRRGKVQNYTLSASGGSEKTTFYVAGNYYREEGTIIDNDRTNYSVRANLTQNLTDKLKLAVLLNGRYIKDNFPTNINNPPFFVSTTSAPGGLSSSGSGALIDAYLNLPYDSAFYADGSGRDPRSGIWYGRDRNNYQHARQYNFARGRSYNTSADLNLDYSITNHLTFSTFNRATIINGGNTVYYDRRTKPGAPYSGALYNSTNYSSTLVSSNRLRYSNNFGQHSLSVLGVAEAEKGYIDYSLISVKGLPPGRSAISTATDVLLSPVGGNDSYLFSKYLGQADYGFAGKYFGVASIVNEFSSRFGTNNPSATFYQLGVSWIVSKESFMKSVEPVSFLKFRGSYGTTGNAEGIGYYASLGLYSITTAASYAGLPGASLSQKANPNLTWEKAKGGNIGVDMALFKRIDLSVDIYRRVTSSLLFFRGLPATTGYTGVFENVGAIRNKGIEFNLTTRNVITKNFRWETNLNMAFNNNKVLEVNQGRSEVNTGARQPVGVGHNMDEWYMPIWAGVDPANGSPLWERLITDADGKSFVTYTNVYNQATFQYTGRTSAPKFTGGFSNTVTYGRFSLNAFLNFAYGYTVYNSPRFNFDSDGLYESFNQMKLPEGWTRWAKKGDIVTHPKPVYGRSDASNAVSSRFLEDASYIRLRNVNLGYDLAPGLTNKLKIGSARLFVSGDNLFTLTNYSGTDPEAAFDTGDPGFKYPVSRKFLAGLNISF